MAEPPDRLARIAAAGALTGFPLWLISYAWVPFAAAGREMGAVRYLAAAGEGLALLAGLASLGLALAARRNAAPGSAGHRLARRAIVLAAGLLLLIVVPNILGVFLLSR